MSHGALTPEKSDSAGVPFTRGFSAIIKSDHSVVLRMARNFKGAFLMFVLAHCFVLLILNPSVRPFDMTFINPLRLVTEGRTFGTSNFSNSPSPRGTTLWYKLIQTSSSPRGTTFWYKPFGTNPLVQTFWYKLLHTSSSPRGTTFWYI
jgi:hypothetical protein